MQVMVIVIAGVLFANKGYIDNEKQKVHTPHSMYAAIYLTIESSGYRK